jgi:hypothetical protein
MKSWDKSAGRVEIDSTLMVLENKKKSLAFLRFKKFDISAFLFF